MRTSKRRFWWPTTLVFFAALTSSSAAHAADGITHDLDGLIFRTHEVLPAPCVLKRFLHKKNGPPGDPTEGVALGDCDPPPPKMWLQGTPDPVDAWLAARMGPWSASDNLVFAVHFRAGTRTPFAVYTIEAPPRPRFGFDPKPLLDSAWTAFPALTRVGATPAAVEGLIDDVDAYQLEGEHIFAGKVQHTSMTVIPTAAHVYVLVSAGPANEAVNKERAALIGAFKVKAPPGSWGLGPSRGYMVFVHVLKVVVLLGGLVFAIRRVRAALRGRIRDQ